MACRMAVRSPHPLPHPPHPASACLGRSQLDASPGAWVAGVGSGVAEPLATGCLKFLQDGKVAGGAEPQQEPKGL